MVDIAVIWRINGIGSKGSLTAHNGLMGMEVPPNFARPVPNFRDCLPRFPQSGTGSAVAKSKRPTNGLSANMKMTKENQIKTSPSLTKKKDKVVLINIGEGRLLKYNNG